MNQNVQHAAAEVNGLAIAGFVISVVGLFTSGLLCPVGLIISLVALGREPKGFAIAGIVVGLIGTCGGLLIALIFGGLILAALGIGLTAVTLANAEQSQLTSDMIDTALAVVEYRDANGVVPPNLETLSISRDKLMDPWGRPYQYMMMTEEPGFELTSAGRDRTFDTDDDVRFTELGDRWDPGGLNIRSTKDGGRVTINLPGGRRLEIVGNDDGGSVVLRDGDRTVRIEGNEDGGRVDIGPDEPTSQPTDETGDETSEDAASGGDADDEAG